MDGKTFHENKKKEVLTLCRELKSAYKEDWPFVFEVMFPDQCTWLKQYKRLKQKHFDK